MTPLTRTMQEAMRFMRAGDLKAATQIIQHGLRGGPVPAAPATDVAAPLSDERCIEAVFRVIPDDPGAPEYVPGTTQPPAADRSERPADEFTNHRFDSDTGTLHYKLFIPGGRGPAPAPLLVMLHGCKQSPDDFARGTRMNALAEKHGYVVAYPAQAQGRNASKCWNWFRSQDQQRGQGEPALIAALTRHLVREHGLDARRVYVAGLSAGGAMAAVLASTYPDLYAAIGVHSGLPSGAAHDVPSAFAAMQRGAGTQARMDPVPAIVFHGDRDKTVDPRNGAAVVAQCMGDAPAKVASGSGAPRPTVERGSAPGGRSYTRTTFRNADGSVAAEQWLVHGAGHAWFGGDPGGSYVDPSGPDASELMLRFFRGKEVKK